MSRRLYRQMAQARTALDRMPPELSAEERAACDREAQAGVDAARARNTESLRLVTHPVIEPVHGWRFRVMRRFETRDGIQFECIGEARTLAAAEDVARREQWAALVFEVGKQRFFNYQPTEMRA